MWDVKLTMDADEAKMWEAIGTRLHAQCRRNSEPPAAAGNYYLNRILVPCTERSKLHVVTITAISVFYCTRLVPRVYTLHTVKLPYDSVWGTRWLRRTLYVPTHVEGTRNGKKRLHVVAIDYL